MKEIAASKDALGYKQCSDHVDCSTSGGEKCLNYTVSGTLDGENLDYEGNTCLTEKDSNCKAGGDEAGVIVVSSDTADAELKADCAAFSIFASPGFMVALVCILAAIGVVAAICCICWRHKRADAGDGSAAVVQEYQA